MARRLTHVAAMTLCLGATVAGVNGCSMSIVDPAAQEAFLTNLGNTSITVFPAFIRNGDDALYDADAATAHRTCSVRRALTYSIIGFRVAPKS